MGGAIARQVRLRLSVTPWRCRLKAAFRARPERRLQPAAACLTDGFNRTIARLKP